MIWKYKNAVSSCFRKGPFKIHNVYSFIFSESESFRQWWAVHGRHPWWKKAWTTRPQLTPAHNNNSSCVRAKYVVTWYPITGLQGEIALVLQAGRYRYTDCSQNNILHKGYSKSEDWNGLRTIKSGPQVYELLTLAMEHLFIWPQVVTAAILPSNNQQKVYHVALSHC